METWLWNTEPMNVLNFYGDFESWPWNTQPWWWLSPLLEVERCGGLSGLCGLSGLSGLVGCCG